MEVDLGAQAITDIHCFSFASTAKFTKDSLAKLFLAGGPTVLSFTPELRRRDLESSVAYRRMLRELSEFLNVRATEAEVISERNRRAVDFQAYTRSLFDDAKIKNIAVDNGLEPLPFEEFRLHPPANVFRIFRIEPLVKKLLQSEKTYGSFIDSFDETISAAIRRNGFVGFKTVIAYRTGLDIQLPTEAGARRSFADRTSRGESEWFGPRVKPLRDFLIGRVAAESRKLGAFLEIHTGVGDTDVVADKCDPLLLKAFLRSDEASKVPVVLIHGGYPYTDGASWLASAFPNVYLELSTPFPPTFLPALSESRYRTILEVVPTTRIVYGSDSIEIPENHWLSARLAKRAMGKALGGLVGEKVLNEDEALRIGERIFNSNALTLLR